MHFIKKLKSKRICVFIWKLSLKYITQSVTHKIYFPFSNFIQNAIIKRIYIRMYLIYRQGIKLLFIDEIINYNNI